MKQCPYCRKKNAKNQRNARHHGELSAIPKFRKSHFANVVACLRQNHEYREGPHEHGVLLVFGGTVSKFWVECPQAKRKRERDADDGLNRIENLHRDFGEARIGSSQVTEYQRNRKTRNQVSAQENL